MDGKPRMIIRPNVPYVAPAINHEGINRVVSDAKRLIDDIENGNSAHPRGATTGTKLHESGVIPEGKSFDDFMADPDSRLTFRRRG